MSTIIGHISSGIVKSEKCMSSMKAVKQINGIYFTLNFERMTFFLNKFIVPEKPVRETMYYMITGKLVVKLYF